MGVDGRMFDGLIRGLILVGVAIGLGIAGLVWLLLWLNRHIDINWVS